MTFDPTNNAFIINIIPLYSPRTLEVQVILVNDAYVLLKDVFGYCYRNVTVNLSGPYQDNDLNSTGLTSNGVLASFLIEGTTKNAAIENNSV